VLHEHRDDRSPWWPTTPPPKPTPAPPAVQEDDAMPYKTLVITDGTHVGKVYMVTPQGPVWVVTANQLATYQEGGIVAKDDPLPTSSKQLGEWIGAD
jgi:hypothetical protein